MMKSKVLMLVFFMVLCLSTVPAAESHKLRVGYYKHKKTCPEAENIVRYVVQNALKEYPGIGAGLIRLLFHDCFVMGCDGSVLLDPSPRNPHPEKEAPTNIGLRGFEIIDEAKRLLEIFCPGVVSCADTVAFAARDASEILNGVKFNITSGRLDGKVSCAIQAEENLPPPTFNREQLEELFVKKKNLTVEDLVVLSGAHTVGRSHCSSLSNRLYPKIDPTLDESFAVSNLMRQCPEKANVDNLVNMDHVTPHALDSQYYVNVLKRQGTFFSDWSLLTSNETRSLVVEYATKPGVWEDDFAESMEKLSKLGVITSHKKGGEIRKHCRFVNHH